MLPPTLYFVFPFFREIREIYFLATCLFTLCPDVSGRRRKGVKLRQGKRIANEYKYYWRHKTVCICAKYIIPSKSGVLKRGAKRRTFSILVYAKSSPRVNRGSFSHSTIIFRNKVYPVGYKMLSCGAYYIVLPVITLFLPPKYAPLNKRDFMGQAEQAKKHKNIYIILLKINQQRSRQDYLF